MTYLDLRGADKLGLSLKLPLREGAGTKLCVNMFAREREPCGLTADALGESGDVSRVFPPCLAACAARAFYFVDLLLLATLAFALL